MIIDTNVHLDRWPFRRVHGDEPDELVDLLRRRGITQAWAGSFDGVFHEEVAAVNERLAETCHTHGDGLLLPFGTVNPALPDWEENLRRCHEEHGMPGVRLYPNYQGFTLSDPAAERLFRMAAERGLVVQVAQKMQDERVHHPRMKVPRVDMAPLTGLVPKISNLRVMAINTLRSTRGNLRRQLAEAGVRFDIAMLEGAGAVGQLIEEVGLEPVMFGSHAPLFYVQATLLKMRESELSPGQSAAILHENAAALLERG